MAKAVKAAREQPKSLLRVYDVEQGSPEWMAARAGLPTASHFATIMANGKDGGPSVTRTKLLHRLAGEVVTGEPAPEGFKSAAMERGNALEAEARESYARRKNVELQRVGFIRNFSGLKECGCSPDSLIGFDGGLEVKTAQADVLIPMLQRPASLPPEHRAQVHGCMWVCERDFWDVTVYCHRSMPAMDIRVYRDDAFIQQISNEVERFSYDLKRLVEQLRNMGSAG